MKREKFLPTTSACIIAAIISTALFVVGFYAMWILLLPVCENIDSSFCGAALFCIVLLALAGVVTALYEFISKRYTELNKRTSDK